MRRIPHRELRNNSSRILEAVRNGEVFEVTNHGDVVAMIVPPAPTEFERLLAAGRIRRPSSSVPFTEIRTAVTERDPLELLDEMRAD